MSIETEQDLISLQKIGKIVALAREEMVKSAKPGMTTAQLDEIGKRILDQYGAVAAPKKEYNFPGTACISISPVAAHGIPDHTVLKEGDIVNIDVSAEFDGYYADTGATLVLQPDSSSWKQRLVECSSRALLKGLEKAKAGTRLNQIGRAIQNEARASGFQVIKNLSGHGIGRKLHEAPDSIVNYYEPRDSRLLRAGLVLAVETFISSGAEEVEEGSDGWALVTPDGSYVAQFEHTIVVTDKAPIILTAV